jgi:hypothetical protein
VPELLLQEELGAVRVAAPTRLERLEAERNVGGGVVETARLSTACGRKKARRIVA